MPPPSWFQSMFWRKTLADLEAEMAAGRRRMVNRKEMDLAIAYERRRMPKGLRFPRQGEVYEALEDVQISYLTAYHAPCTGGGKAVLPKGECVSVCEHRDEKPISVNCHPLRYDELHDTIVPREERENPLYCSYYFCIRTTTLNKSFRLVANALPERPPSPAG